MRSPKSEKEKEERELRITAIEQFNALRRELFTTAWELAEEYEFDDRLRLTEKQIKQYNQILMDQDELRKFVRLETIQDNFGAFPPFWYNLGHIASYISGNPDLPLEEWEREYYRAKAKAYFAKYEGLNKFNILREDQMTAAFALEYVDLLLLEENPDIEKITGLKVTSNKKRNTSASVHFKCGLDLSLSCGRRLDLQPVGAEIIATEDDGNPALVCNRYGKGKIYFLPFCLEKSLVDEQGALDCGAGKEYYKIYELIFRDSLKRRVISKSSPFFGLTEHIIDQDTCIVAAVNYQSQEGTLQMVLDKGWQFSNLDDANITVESGGIRLIKIKKI